MVKQKVSLYHLIGNRFIVSIEDIKSLYNWEFRLDKIPNGVCNPDHEQDPKTLTVSVVRGCCQDCSDCGPTQTLSPLNPEKGGTKMYNENVKFSEEGPSIQMWLTLSDKDLLTDSDRAILEGDAEPTDSVWYCEVNANLVSEIENKTVPEPKHDADIRLNSGSRVDCHPVYGGMNELRKVVNLYADKGVGQIKIVMHDSASKRLGISNAPVYGGL
jgi:hypothetical protein